MTKHEKACVIYCQLNSHTHNQIKIIEGILSGLTANEIIRQRKAPNLSIATIYNIFSKFKKLLDNKEAK
ncbi:hypothetical protein [uncultured Vibrio sp.]|uniref:hypothetical protein n=1 Tax=uncultured Vibrio sp. TaxID=114054 RepID=UPI00260AF43C|nr:hypothetical protein [uncultured Vibrio sp.]